MTKKENTGKTAVAQQSGLKRFPSDLNRWDSQEVKDERVFVH